MCLFSMKCLLCRSAFALYFFFKYLLSNCAANLYLPRSYAVNLAFSAYSFFACLFAARTAFVFLLSYFLLACSSASTVLSEKNVPLQWTDQSTFYVARYLALGELNQVKSILESVSKEERLRLSNVDVDYIVLLGVYWLQTKDVQKALEHYEAAMTKFPTNVSILNNYGLALLLSDRYVEACSWFEKAVSLSNISSNSALINLSRCELVNKNVNKSQMYLKQAKEIADLPYIGLLTALNLALIQSDSEEVRKVYKTLQTKAKKAHYSKYKNEYKCLSRLVKLNKIKAAVYSHSPPSLCISMSR